MKSFGQKLASNPVYQAALIFAVALVFILIEKFLTLVGLIQPDPLNPWIVVTSFILFYSVATSVLSLKIKQARQYWGRSILAFIAILLLSALTAQLFSGLSINEASSFRWLFIVMAIGYLVFMSIARLIKRIVDIAIKQDERLRGE